MFSNDLQNEGFNIRVNFNLKDISNVGGTRAQIWLTATINGERVRLYTRQLIKKEYWVKSCRNQQGGGYVREDNSLGRVILNENKAVNKKLKEILSYCEEYVRIVSSNHLQVGAAQMQHSAESFKGYVESRILGTRIDSEHAERFIENYINAKAREVNPNTGRTISEGTIYNHRNALQRLKGYTETKGLNLTWKLFSEDFERDFTAWMNMRDYTPNTIASQYSIIKVWLKDADKKGLIENKAYQNYRTATHEVENIYLTEAELYAMYNVDLSHAEINSQSKVEESRDLFIIGCLTGLRYSDYASLPQIDESTDTISVRCHKTNRRVVIPLHPLVKEIYRKYNGTLPKPIDRGRALKNVQYCAKLANITTHVTLSRTHGGITTDVQDEKWKFIMNHTARRSFATNMYLKGVPTLSIMSVTGHTTESNFMKYIKVSAEQHARIVASHF